MSEQDPTPPRPGQPRVVKKVVKRTVVRPASTSAARVSRPAGSSPAPSGQAPTDSPSRRPRVDVGAVRQRSRGWSERGRGALTSGAAGVRRGAGAGRDFAADRYSDVRAYRLPAQPPMRSAVVVGLLLGAAAVVVGWASGLLFTQVRGTSAGGGVWGGLVVVLLAVLAAWGGGRLLTSLGVDHGPTVSVLAVVLVLVLVLAFLLQVAAGPWAWLVVPLVTAATYAGSLALVRLATADPQEAA